jgi:hypothetical protein
MALIAAPLAQLAPISSHVTRPAGSGVKRNDALHCSGEQLGTGRRGFHIGAAFVHPEPPVDREQEVRRGGRSASGRSFVEL